MTALFVLSTAVLLVNTLLERPLESVIGLVLAAAGVPGYVILERRVTLRF